MTNRKGKLREKHSMSPSMEDKGGPAPPGASEIVSEKVTQEKSQPSRILNKSDKDNTSSMKSVDLRQAADLRVANTDGNSSIKSTKLPKAKPGARVLDGETGKASSMKSVDLRKAADLRVANTDGNPSIKSTKLPKKKRVLDGESVNMPSTETSEASIIADLRKETPENNVFSDAVLFNVVATDVKGALRILAAGDRTSVGVHSTLGDGDGTSVDGDSTSVDGDSTSVELDTTSVELDTTSVELDTTSVELDTTSVELDTTSVELDTTSGDVYSTLLDGDSTSADVGSTLLDGDSTSAGVGSTSADSTSADFGSTSADRRLVDVDSPLGDLESGFGDGHSRVGDVESALGDVDTPVVEDLECGIEKRSDLGIGTDGHVRDAAGAQLSSVVEGGGSKASGSISTSSSTYYQSSKKAVTNFVNKYFSFLQRPEADFTKCAAPLKEQSSSEGYGSIGSPVKGSGVSGATHPEDLEAQSLAPLETTFFCVPNWLSAIFCYSGARAALVLLVVLTAMLLGTFVIYDHVTGRGMVAALLPSWLGHGRKRGGRRDKNTEWLSWIEDLELSSRDLANGYHANGFAEVEALVGEQQDLGPPGERRRPSQKRKSRTPQELQLEREREKRQRANRAKQYVEKRWRIFGNALEPHKRLSKTLKTLREMKADEDQGTSWEFPSFVAPPTSKMPDGGEEVEGGNDEVQVFLYEPCPNDFLSEAKDRRLPRGKAGQAWQEALNTGGCAVKRFDASIQHKHEDPDWLPSMFDEAYLQYLLWWSFAVEEGVNLQCAPAVFAVSQSTQYFYIVMERVDILGKQTNIFNIMEEERAGSVNKLYQDLQPLNDQARLTGVVGSEKYFTQDQFTHLLGLSRASSQGAFEEYLKKQELVLPSSTLQRYLEDRSTRIMLFGGYQRCAEALVISGVTHRDIKLENLALHRKHVSVFQDTSATTNEQAKALSSHVRFIDFGAAGVQLFNQGHGLGEDEKMGILAHIENPFPGSLHIFHPLRFGSPLCLSEIEQDPQYPYQTMGRHLDYWGVSKAWVDALRGSNSDESAEHRMAWAFPTAVQQFACQLSNEALPSSGEFASVFNAMEKGFGSGTVHIEQSTWWGLQAYVCGKDSRKLTKTFARCFDGYADESALRIIKAIVKGNFDDKELSVYATGLQMRTSNEARIDAGKGNILSFADWLQKKKGDEVFWWWQKVPDRKGGSKEEERAKPTQPKGSGFFGGWKSWARNLASWMG